MFERFTRFFVAFYNALLDGVDKHISTILEGDETRPEDTMK